MRAFVLLIAAALSWPAPAQDLWKPAKRDGDVTVFTQQLPGRSYQSFKAVGFLQSTRGELADILNDVAGYKQWFAYLDSVELLDTKADDRYIYLEIDFPWPFANEDMVFRMSPSETGTGDRKYLLQGLPAFSPIRAGINRMRDASGYILLEADYSGTRLTFVMHMELSGEIPPWLANRNIHFLPLRTLKNLASKSMPDQGAATRR